MPKIKSHLSFQILSLLAVGFLLGLGYTSYAQGTFHINPLFQKIDPEKDVFYTGVTEDEKNFTLLYGRLDYMTDQLERVIDTCAK